MGVPIDRGLTQSSSESFSSRSSVEMGVPIDRGLTRLYIFRYIFERLVEIGVPIDSEPTHSMVKIRTGLFKV